MGRRALPAVLAFVALMADLAGAHSFALVMLFGAIPAAFVLVLDCFGDALQEERSLTRPVVAGCGLVLLVLSAALRSPAVVGGVPRLAVSAIVLCLLLYSGLAAAALVVLARRAQPRPVASAAEDTRTDRIAA